MSTSQLPAGAADLGLMAGFPPAPDARVSHANQLYGPYNRWSFQHELQLNRTADVWRGAGPVARLERSPRDLSAVGYRNRAGEHVSFDLMVELSYTDGIIVLHRGRVIYERYLNGMQPHTLHAWASGSKSMTGTIAALLVHEGLIDPAAPVAEYLPELRDSGFGDASVAQVMAMTTALAFHDQRPAETAENWWYGVAMGWIGRPDGYAGPESVYEILPLMGKGGRHGERFAYLTPNTDALAWIIRRVTGRSLAEVMRERIWDRLGAERDAFWIVDAATAETAGSGLITTLPDMARFGQMLLDRGHFNGAQIIPAAVVAEIERGGDRAAFARSAAASPANQGYSYNHQWWVTHGPHGAYQAIGYGGQMLYIAPGAELVVAKMSSYPTPTPAGNEFYSAFAALPALADALAG
ncbi:MAG TPA: serine hydrolase [Herpetosiphonaceae bacterium]|nr:serine hydrolase [Herpetosiphonaceae bacterium]